MASSFRLSLSPSTAISLSSQRQQQQQPQQCRRPFAAKPLPPSTNELTVSDILGQYMQRRKQLKPYQLALDVWNKLGKVIQKSRQWERQTFWIDHKASLQMLVEQTVFSIDHFNGRSTATVMHSLVKLLQFTNSSKILGDLQPLWNLLVKRTHLLLLQPNSFSDQSVSNLLWAYAKIDGIEVDGQLMDALANRAVLVVDDFMPQGLANVAWGFATLSHKAPLLFDAIARASQVQIHEFNPQSLSNTSWAFATLKHEAPLLFGAIATAAQVHINEFKPQELSSLIMAYAKMNHNAPALLDAVARAAAARIHDFKPQELSNTVWSFATLKHEAPALLDAIAEAVQERIQDFKPQELSNTVWSFATLKRKSPMLFDAIAEAVQERIQDFKPQELSNTAWSFATLKHTAPALLDAIAPAAQGWIQDFNPQELSNMAWSFATLNHEAPSLLDAIARAIPARVGDYNAQDLANTSWAFAAMNHEAPSLFDAIARMLRVRVGSFNSQSLTNMAWSFAVFNIQQGSFIPADSPFFQALLAGDPSKFTVQNLCQMHQFYLWCKEQNGENWLSQELQWQCREAFVSAETAPSRIQNDVVETLQTLPDVSQAEVEVLTESGYNLDAVIVYREDEKIAVEVDGPSHFVGRSQSPNGATLLKRRQLRALEGWKLVTIPYWEWDAIDTGPEQERREKKQRYLQNLLEQAAQ
jgi:RAP domain/FAST kinase-like protein, subdomain 1